jgi:hypothetical protein
VEPAAQEQLVRVPGLEAVETFLREPRGVADLDRAVVSELNEVDVAGGMRLRLRLPDA